MRLDLCLKHSGLLKNREAAKYYCERKLVKVNGEVKKATAKIKSGDLIEIYLGKLIAFYVYIEDKGNVKEVTYKLAGKNYDA